jgi:hypothetical protein
VKKRDFGQLEALGVVLTIEGSVGYPLKLDSLESLSRHRAARRPKWMLLSVTPESAEVPESAMVVGERRVPRAVSSTDRGLPV